MGFMRQSRVWTSQKSLSSFLSSASHLLCNTCLHRQMHTHSHKLKSIVNNFSGNTLCMWLLPQCSSPAVVPQPMLILAMKSRDWLLKLTALYNRKTWSAAIRWLQVCILFLSLSLKRTSQKRTGEKVYQAIDLSLWCIFSARAATLPDINLKPGWTPEKFNWRLQQYSQLLRE